MFGVVYKYYIRRSGPCMPSFERVCPGGVVKDPLPLLCSTVWGKGTSVVVVEGEVVEARGTVLASKICDAFGYGTAGLSLDERFQAFFFLVWIGIV